MQQNCEYLSPKDYIMKKSINQNTGKSVNAKKAVIRAENDLFRESFIGGYLNLSDGAQKLPKNKIREVLEKIRSYNRFYYGFDERGIHDCGAVEYGDDVMYFSIDICINPNKFLSDRKNLVSDDIRIMRLSTGRELHDDEEDRLAMLDYLITTSHGVECC